MVSPQNPLKPVAGMAPFAERLDQCPGGRSRAQAHSRHRYRRPARRLVLHRRHAEAADPAFSLFKVCLADGRRQSGAVAALGALGRDFRDRAHCRVRPALLRAKGARRRRGSALRSQPGAGSVRAPAGRDKTAGLGVFSYRARSDFRDPDSIRAQDGADATFDGAKTRIGHDHRTALAPPPAAIPHGGTAGNPRPRAEDARRRQGRGDRHDRSRRQDHDRRLHGDREWPLGAPGRGADRASRSGAVAPASGLRSRARSTATGC